MMYDYPCNHIAYKNAKYKVHFPSRFLFIVWVKLHQKLDRFFMGLEI
jgi:hypothetical protein